MQNFSDYIQVSFTYLSSMLELQSPVYHLFGVMEKGILNWRQNGGPKYDCFSFIFNFFEYWLQYVRCVMYYKNIQTNCMVHMYIVTVNSCFCYKFYQRLLSYLGIT